MRSARHCYSLTIMAAAPTHPQAELHRRSWVKRAFAIVALLVAGMFVSVVVAWGIESVGGFGVGGRPLKSPGVVGALAVPHPSKPDRQLYIEQTGSIGHTHWFAIWEPTAGIRRPFEVVARPKLLNSVPTWVRRPGPEDICYDTDAYGFPFPCLMKYSSLSLSDAIGGTVTYHGTLSLQHSRSKSRWSFPLILIPVGLFENTLFYAALFSSPWVFGALSRRRRIRRGHCPFCNYDLRGEFSRPCSECGQTWDDRGAQA